MAIPGLFVEYLINGALAFAFSFPLLQKYIEDFPTGYIPVLILSAYVVGMVIDFFAFIITRPIKRIIRKYADNKFKIKRDNNMWDIITREVRTTLYAPEISKAISMMSSRDRIARGTIVNLIFGSIILFPKISDSPILSFIICFGSVVTITVMWMHFENASYQYERKAEQAIEEKLAVDKNIK